MSVLQYGFYHLLELVQLLHTLHHHGIPLLQYIQGESDVILFVAILTRRRVNLYFFSHA